MPDSPFYMGIDGGGSNLRVVIVDADLALVAEANGPGVNPNTVGWERASDLIHATMRDAIDSAHIDTTTIHAVGIGIGGAEPGRAEAWLKTVVSDVLPDTKIALSGDHEIALVGAHGMQRGVLILAGTGSIAYGMRGDGETVLVGGWGYLLGDEGSGYWLGMQALQAVVKDIETRGRPTSMTQSLLAAYDLTDRDSIITWTYTAHRYRHIAQFAPTVLEHAVQGDAVARDLVDRAAYELALMTTTVYQRLDMPDLPLAFSGSLLLNENVLQTKLCARLKLDTPPLPKYEAKIGAAILARDRFNK